jgi:hypothetical protein
MVVMAMREHESIDLRRMNSQQSDVVVQGLWREAEIDQDVSRIVAKF